MATNCIKHARSPYSVSLITDGPAICVEVLNTGPGIPRPQPLDDRPSSGRGLHIVEELADTWGITAEKYEGKTVVWFTVDHDQMTEAFSPAALPLEACEIRLDGIAGKGPRIPRVAV